MSLTESLDRLGSHYSNTSRAPPVDKDDEILKFVRTVRQKQGPESLDTLFDLDKLAAACSALRNSAAGPDEVSPLLIAHAPEAFHKCLLYV